MKLYVVMGVIAWVSFASGWVAAMLFVTWIEKLK